jgi:hypothetical protein
MKIDGKKFSQAEFLTHIRSPLARNLCKGFPENIFRSPE